MSDKRFTLDTNILIYAVDKDAKIKHDIARDIIDQSMVRDCVLTVQSLAEFFSAATRRKYATPEQVSEFIQEWLKIFPVSGNSVHSLKNAIFAVKEYNLSFWDAMIWAVSKEAGCTVILTEDFQDGRKLDGILFCNPFKPRNEPFIKQLLNA